MEKTTDPLAEQEPDIPEAADGIDGQEGDNLPIESNTEEIYEPQPFMVENDGCASLIDQAKEECFWLWNKYFEAGRRGK